MNQNSVKKIKDIFLHKLVGFYDEKEIMEILYTLFDHFLGWSKSQVHLNASHILSHEDIIHFHKALSQLRKNKPIQYITGRASFLDMELLVSPDVLIPRHETEELVEWVSGELNEKKIQDFSVLDIGTGSGCIAISLKKKFPSSRIAALDNSTSALRMASQNAFINQTEIRFIHSDILYKDSWSLIPDFDFIVSNPPYVMESEKKLMRKNVLDYEPATALFVPDSDPLMFCSAIADFSKDHLIRPGNLYLEINERFGKEVKELLHSKGFERVDVVKDLNGKDRFVRSTFLLE